MVPTHFPFECYGGQLGLKSRRSSCGWAEALGVWSVLRSAWGNIKSFKAGEGLAMGKFVVVSSQNQKSVNLRE